MLSALQIKENVTDKNNNNSSNVQVCDKLQASQHVPKSEPQRGVSAGALPSLCHTDTTQQRTGPHSLCLPGIAKGPQGTAL